MTDERAKGRRDYDRSAKILRSAASEINQGLLVIDDELRIVFVNDRYRGYFGVPNDHPLFQEGEPLERMLRFLADRGEYGPGGPEDHVESRMKPVRNRIAYNLDRQLSDGRYVQINGNPVPDGGYVFMFTDITERVEEKKRLDELVRERTDALHEVNTKLIDGIEYARLIQTGILPQPSFFQKNLGPHFILFRPVDIVGGDFYLGVETDYGIFMGLGDCTGHGVPGAMMTMMASSVCRRAISEVGRKGPVAVLNALDDIVRTNLHQTEARVGPDTGLEMILCFLDPKTGTIRMAAAGLDIYIQDGAGEIERLRGDKLGLGYGRQAASAKDLVEYERGFDDAVRVFLTSDGILDQAGGEKGYGFGRRRLMEALKAGSDQTIEEQGRRFGFTLDEYCQGNPQRDDLTLLGFTPRRL